MNRITSIIISLPLIPCYIRTRTLTRAWPLTPAPPSPVPGVSTDLYCGCSPRGQCCCLSPGWPDGGLQEVPLLQSQGACWGKWIKWRLLMETGTLLWPWEFIARASFYIQLFEWKKSIISTQVFFLQGKRINKIYIVVLFLLFCIIFKRLSTAFPVCALAVRLQYNTEYSVTYKYIINTGSKVVEILSLAYYSIPPFPRQPHHQLTDRVVLGPITGEQAWVF